MLLRLILAPQVPNYSIPINVNTQVRHLIRLATRTFHRYCDENIIRERRWQSFDAYTFSQLHIPNRKINENRIMGEKNQLPSLFHPRMSSSSIAWIKSSKSGKSFRFKQPALPLYGQNLKRQRNWKKSPTLPAFLLPL